MHIETRTETVIPTEVNPTERDGLLKHLNGLKSTRQITKTARNVERDCSQHLLTKLQNNTSFCDNRNYISSDCFGNIHLDSTMLPFL